MDQEKLVDDLLNGKIVLFSMSDIQKKLSISRSTLNRWIKNGESVPWLFNSIERRMLDISSWQEDDEDQSIVFPTPDLYIGNSPRWAKETVKKWILMSQKNK